MDVKGQTHQERDPTDNRYKVMFYWFRCSKLLADDVKDLRSANYYSGSKEECEAYVKAGVRFGGVQQEQFEIVEIPKGETA